MAANFAKLPERYDAFNPQRPCAGPVSQGVASAAVDGAVTDANIREVGRTIIADRDVARSVDHPVVDAIVPANNGLRVQIAKARRCLADTSLLHNGKRP